MPDISGAKDPAICVGVQSVSIDGWIPDELTLATLYLKTPVFSSIKNNFASGTVLAITGGGL